MRLGLITDVHNHAAELAEALQQFRDHRVEQVVTIGDTCDAFSHGAGADEVASLLSECRAVGVWGNHDFTLCQDVSAKVRDRYPPIVLEVMARMKPRLVIEGCHFSHKESSVDPDDITQLWDIGDQPPDLRECAHHAFEAVDTAWQFVGHYHRWWAGTPEEVLDWKGTEPLSFEPDQRYFVVVAAVCDGWCAVLDTERGELEPLRCGPV